MFRTQTGQTGMDAYIYEVTAIANAQRDLDKRFNDLVEVIREESTIFNHLNGTPSTDYMFKPGARTATGLLEYMRTGGAAGYEQRCIDERKARRIKKEEDK